MKGDAAIRQADGSFTFHGRSDEVINVGGNRIGTEEIENAILLDREREGSPVSNCVVVGMKDETLNTAPCAFLILRAGATLQPVDEGKLCSLVQSRLGGHAVPRRYVVCGALPETYSGKYMRRILRAMVDGDPLGDIGALKNPECVEPLCDAIARSGKEPATRAPAGSAGKVVGSSHTSRTSRSSERVLQDILEVVASIQCSPTDADASLLGQGFDSIKFVRLHAALRTSMGEAFALTPAQLLQLSTPREVAEQLVSPTSTHKVADDSTALEQAMQDLRSERLKLSATVASARATGSWVPPAPEGTATPPGAAPKYALVGGGGHASDIVALIKHEARCEVVGIFDDNPASHGTHVNDVEVLGDTTSVPAGANWIIAIGQNEVRKKIAERCAERANCGLAYWPIHQCRVAESATIGAGTYIADGVYIGPRAKIGKHVIINGFASIGHDTVVGDFAFVGGGAMLAGFAVVEEGGMVGMGAVVAPKKRVGAWSSVVVNSGVITDIPPHVACGGVHAVVFGPTERTKVA